MGPITEIADVDDNRRLATLLESAQPSTNDRKEAVSGCVQSAAAVPLMMMRFLEPKLERMHSGNLCALLTEAGTWESFEAFAEKWAAQIGARIVDRVDGPDVRVWQMSYNDQLVNLVYDDFPNGVSVEAVDAESNAAIEQLFSLVSSEALRNSR